MPSLRELLEHYGVDYQATMPRFMGNEGLYKKLLGMLFQDANLEKLGKAIQDGDLTAAFEAAHTLKGVAANMGLTPYYQAICSIVEPLRCGEARCDYPELYQNIVDEFKKVEALSASVREGESA